MNLRPGQKMDAQSCRYCRGTGSIMMTQGFVRGYRQRIGRRCTHVVGDPLGENPARAILDQSPDEAVTTTITHAADCISFFAASPGPCDCDAGKRQ